LDLSANFAGNATKKVLCLKYLFGIRPSLSKHPTLFFWISIPRANQLIAARSKKALQLWRGFVASSNRRRD
jgi:hypothetical protein